MKPEYNLVVGSKEEAGKSSKQQRLAQPRSGQHEAKKSKSRLREKLLASKQSGSTKIVSSVSQGFGTSHEQEADSADAVGSHRAGKDAAAAEEEKGGQRHRQKALSSAAKVGKAQ